MLQRKKRKEILTQDESRMLMHLQKIITIDTDDIEATDKEHDQLLHLAIEFYLKSLLYETDDDGDISQVFRFFGLWISNQSDAWVTSEMSRCYKQIPSYKFVPLMPQITAHLGSSNMELAVVIGKIVRKYLCTHAFLGVNACSSNKIFNLLHIRSMCHASSSSRDTENLCPSKCLYG